MPAKCSFVVGIIITASKNFLEAEVDSGIESKIIANCVDAGASPVC